MMKSICVVVPDLCVNESAEFVKYLEDSDFVKEVFIYGNDTMHFKNKKFRLIDIQDLNSIQNLRVIASNCKCEYLLLLKDKTWINPGQFAIERMLSVAEDTGAGIVYSDYIELKEEIHKYHSTMAYKFRELLLELNAKPTKELRILLENFHIHWQTYKNENGETYKQLIDYQEGSLRDDFDFGPLTLINFFAFKNGLSSMNQQIEKAGIYYLRLKISQNYSLVRIPEYLYSVKELDSRKSGQILFDYVDPKNRNVQIEMENVVTEHLKDIGAYLEPQFKNLTFDEAAFKVKASVIIPVKNRFKTIEDAVKSVLIQKTNFEFNLIVVDNYSNDGTSEILEFIAQTNKHLIHHIPARTDLGIGGCWNEGVHHEKCGMFAIQLDSDDMYKDENTLQKIVDAFYEQKCAMVVGTYKLVNFKLEEIPPGIIDHKEWTPENGRNNALRINGLGAPRAFYTPLLREFNIPNVSYGEDYAVGLAISRNYQIGRIYEVLYLCRRWEDNSDAALDIEKQNKHNLYKDRIRTIELKARQKLNLAK